MTPTRIHYNSDGLTTHIAIPFPYLDPDDIHVVTDDGVPVTIQSIGSGFITLANPVTVNMGFTLFRSTSRDALKVSFQGGPLRSRDANTAFTQLLYLLQEYMDANQLIGGGQYVQAPGDAEAATLGVPLWGPYLNGGVLQVRTT